MCPSECARTCRRLQPPTRSASRPRPSRPRSQARRPPPRLRHPSDPPPPPPNPTPPPPHPPAPTQHMQGPLQELRGSGGVLLKALPLQCLPLARLRTDDQVQLPARQTRQLVVTTPPCGNHQHHLYDHHHTYSLFGPRVCLLSVATSIFCTALTVQRKAMPAPHGQYFTLNDMKHPLQSSCHAYCCL